MTFLHRAFEKLNMAAARLYTAAIKGSFGAFGRRSLVYFPNNLAGTEGIYLGDGVRIMAGCWIGAIQGWAGREYGGRIEIGDGSLITYDTQISACSRITIGRNVGIGRGSVIADHLHEYRDIRQPILYGTITEGQPVVIEDDCFIGVNCVIAPGVHIGRHVFVGSNTVVTKDIPSFTFAVGTPAKVIRRYDFDTKQWVTV